MSLTDIHVSVEHEDRSGRRDLVDDADRRSGIGLVLHISKPSPRAWLNSAARCAFAGAVERVLALLARQIGGGSAYPVPLIATARRRRCAERRLDRFTT